MKSRLIDPNKERNPITRQRHRKEVLWQITFPLLITGLILLAFSILSITMTPEETSVWADISLIWLIMPVMVLTLISLAMLIASIYAVLKLIQVLPVFAFRLQNGLILIRANIRTIADRSVEPVLRINSFSAGIKGFVRQISGR
jgi:FtsH-binding integral membrane protein